VKVASTNDLSDQSADQSATTKAWNGERFVYTLQHDLFLSGPGPLPPQLHNPFQSTKTILAMAKKTVVITGPMLRSLSGIIASQENHAASYGRR
jgi:hypothetical protein